MPANEDLLSEIRKNYDYAKAEWDSIRKEGDIDMRYVAGDPWSPDERRAREALNRPVLTLDELGQYTNQMINNYRANPRSIKVSPRGYGADAKSAEYREGRIRQIEYASRAKLAYTQAFENQIQRSYGFLRVVAEYVGKNDFNQELRIKAIPNPNVILYDPDAKELDGSDARWCFELDEMPQAEFASKYPKARKLSFDASDMAAAPGWVKEDGRIVVAGYWKVKEDSYWLYEVEDGQGGVLNISERDMPEGIKVHGNALENKDGETLPFLRRRKEIEKKVCRYPTNGFEILEEEEWPGSWIPIVPVYGKVLYVDEGSGTKRKILSIVRLARDAYMLYCYLRTQQAEFAAMVPKNPAIGYEGQFENHEDEWKDSLRKPMAFVQAKATVEGVAALLPLPTRPQWDATPLMALGNVAEEAKRAIQSAMGMFNASVGRSDSTGKSGKAIEALNQQSQTGNFHFLDNFERSLEQLGRIIEELIPVYDDTQREVAVRDVKDEQKVVQINAPGGPQVAEGDHDVTISTGQNFDSQRDEAMDVSQAIVGNPAVLQAALGGSQQAGKLFANAIRQRQLGPIGDEMAEIFDPKDQEQPQIPPQLQQAMQQAQQAVQMLTARVKELESGVEKARLDNETKLKIAELDSATKLQIADKNEAIATQGNAAKMSIEELWARLASVEKLLSHAQASAAPTVGSTQPMEQPEPQELDETVMM